MDSLLGDDRHLLQQLYDNNYTMARALIIRNSGTEDECKDIYQEAFLTVWRSIQLQQFSPREEKEFSAYLIRVCKNKWIDELRKRKTQQKTTWEEDYHGQIIEESYNHEADIYIKAVRQQYKLLGQRCRELLGRFYFRKQGLREIATEFSWTEATAKNNKYRCLKQLRDLVIKGKRG
ncbi:MAG TPA: sigma-70 family RNA polymerase sigma factor [Sphingobacterium sp.]|nr:sigma-70 family RNA polymerase sigma factor [Sphingobacterium sp.]